jgi:hypothetical protein
MSSKASLSKEEQAKAKQLLDSLEADSKCYIFLEPVDYIGLGLADYLDIVENPMDISTIRSKLKNLKYSSVKDFLSDINLIWHNCKLYNQEGSEIYLLAVAMEKTAKKLIDKYFKEKKKPEKSKAIASNTNDSQAMNDSESIPMKETEPAKPSQTLIRPIHKVQEE